MPRITKVLQAINFHQALSVVPPGIQLAPLLQGGNRGIVIGGPHLAMDHACDLTRRSATQHASEQGYVRLRVRAGLRPKPRRIVVTAYGRVKC